MASLKRAAREVVPNMLKCLAAVFSTPPLVLRRTVMCVLPRTPEFPQTKLGRWRNVSHGAVGSFACDPGYDDVPAKESSNTLV